MNFLRDAGRSLSENVRPVLVYMAVAAVLMTAASLLKEFVISPTAEDTPDRLLGVELIGMRIVLVAVMSIADTIIFSRIGREVDKPYWRIATDREAIVRFYRLWLLLGLAVLVYQQLIDQIAGGDAEHPATIFLVVSQFVLIVLLNAFGTTVMFYGRAAREEISEAFATMGRHSGPIIFLCLVGIFAGILLSMTNSAIMISELSLTVRLVSGALLAAADGYISCLMFAFVWQVCRYDRDHADREDFDI